jgi:2-iminoacetate synthase
MFGAGINQVSAGSKTSPGAYAGGNEEDGANGAGEQFPVSDDRTPAEVVEAIRAKRLEWVWKDWDRNLKPVS